VPRKRASRLGRTRQGLGFPLTRKRHNVEGSHFERAASQASVQFSNSISLLNFRGNVLIVLISGPYSTASTWVYNVVSSIYSSFVAEESFALYAGDASYLLANTPLRFDNLIIKAHFFDNNLIRVLTRFDTRIIVTSRDPADIVVSYHRRSNNEILHIIRDISRSWASITEARTLFPALTLRYENCFTSTRSSLDAITSFLGREVSDSKLDAIFENHQIDTLRKSLSSENSDHALSITHSPDHKTQWHLDHIGDGRVGKGKEILPSTLVQSLSHAFWAHPASHSIHAKCKSFTGREMAHSTLVDQPVEGSICWTAPLFSYGDDRREIGAGAVIACDGGERYLVYGPYLYLQTGVWRAYLKINSLNSSPPLRLRVDVMDGFSIVAKTILINGNAVFTPELEFDHIDHLTPLEIRIISIPDGRSGSFVFSGAELVRLGPTNHADRLSMSVRL